jgi:hypothetical protein
MTAPRHRIVSRLFAGREVGESVTGGVYFDAAPEAVWRRLLFYEDVPGRAPLLLRAVLPCAVRTEGDKTRVGEQVRCTYARGDLVKRITAIEPARLLQFEVIEQNLGIEACVRVRGGSYRCSPCGAGTFVALVTSYRAYLHPRYLWRPLEALLVRQLHHHLLNGVRVDLLRTGSLARPASRSSDQRSPGGVPCTSHSCSHR